MLTDPRSPEEQAAAAELSSRLAKLRAEHQGSAAKAALDLDQAADGQSQVAVHGDPSPASVGLNIHYMHCISSLAQPCLDPLNTPPCTDFALAG